MPSSMGAMSVVSGTGVGCLSLVGVLLWSSQVGCGGVTLGFDVGEWS